MTDEQKAASGPYLHPNQSPEEMVDNARRMAELRWADVPAAERSEAMRQIAAHREYGPMDPSQARCPCGAMTLKRAQTRADLKGKGLGHKSGCTFYRRRPHRRGARPKSAAV